MLFRSGPCKLVYDVNDESPLFAIDMIGRKRVWAETESNIQVIENSVYHSDRLSKMINVDGNNVLTNAAHGRSLLPYVQKKPLKIIENEKITECNELYIDGPSRWVYNPDKRLEVENHKFSVWIETDSSITILS